MTEEYRTATCGRCGQRIYLEDGTQMEPCGCYQTIYPCWICGKPCEEPNMADCCNTCWPVLATKHPQRDLFVALAKTINAKYDSVQDLADDIWEELMNAVEAFDESDGQPKEEDD